jgi:TetR/AcrR family transcriptional regulator, repressor for neighboring sulfatase
MAKSPPLKAKNKRVRRSPEAARQLILDAAVQTMSTQGPAGCGLKDVAKAAGVSHALVTHYFGTYENLVELTIDEAMTQLRKRLIERMLKIEHPTPERMVQLYVDIALEPWYGRLIGWAVLNDHDASSPMVKRMIPQMKLMAAATEYVFSQAGEPPSRDETEALLVSVWAVVVGYVAGNHFFWTALGRKPGPSRDRLVRDVLAKFARDYERNR